MSRAQRGPARRRLSSQLPVFLCFLCFLCLLCLLCLQSARAGGPWHALLVGRTRRRLGRLGGPVQDFLDRTRELRILAGSELRRVVVDRDVRLDAVPFRKPLTL